jgi:hypothetical protein
LKRIDDSFYRDVNCVKSLANFNKSIGDTQANLKLMQKLAKGSIEDRQAATIVAGVMNQ